MDLFTWCPITVKTNLQWHKADQQVFGSEGGGEINGKKGEYLEVMKMFYIFTLVVLDSIYLSKLIEL